MDVALANIAVQFLHLRSWWYGNGCKWGCVWNIIKTIIETHQMPGTRWNTDKDKAIWNAFSTTAPFYLKFHKSKGLSLVAASINIEKHDVPASPRLNYLLWEPSRDCASGIMGAPGEGCTDWLSTSPFNLKPFNYHYLAHSTKSEIEILGPRSLSGQFIRWSVLSYLSNAGWARTTAQQFWERRWN